MKILVISQYFWPENFVINEIVFSLNELNNDVYVLTGKPNYPVGKIFEGYKYFTIEKEFKNKVEIFRVPIFPRLTSFLTLILNYLSYVLSASLFGPFLVKSKDFDVILVYGVSPILQALPAILLSKIYKKPVILWLQDLWPESISATKYSNNNFLFGIIRLLVKFIYNNVHLLLAQSKGFYKKILDLNKTTPLDYLPNSYPFKEFKYPKKIIDGDEIFKNKFNFLFAGNMGKAQSLTTILNTAKLLEKESNISFIFIGEGSQKRFLKKEVFRKKLKNVIFVDQKPPHLMPYFFKKASALLVTLSDNEVLNLTLPSKIQAYLSSQMPIIAAINGTSADILLESGAALVSPAEDSYALRDSIIKFIKLSDQKKKIMSKNGKIYFDKNFSQEVIINKLLQYIFRVTKLNEKKS